MNMSKKKNGLVYDETFTQTQMQSYLEQIQEEKGLTEALEALYDWSKQSGYLHGGLFNENVHYSYKDKATGVTFRTQINYARSKYSAAPGSAKAKKARHCPICFENIGGPGKELLRAFSFDLGHGRHFFAQLTPFPLYPYHFVVIDHDPHPMILSTQSIKDMTAFVELAPEYVACSNSDVEWAGASILVHHHYQMFKGLELPIMQAAWHGDFFNRTNVKGYTFCWGFLNYPIATLKIRCRDKNAFIAAAGELIKCWKNQVPGKNTMNLVVHLDKDRYWVGYLILRNPDHRTPKSLSHIKTEGVGIIEVAGEGIYPVPQGGKAEAIQKQIKDEGLTVINSLIKGNNPLPKKGWPEQFKCFSQSIKSLIM